MRAAPSSIGVEPKEVSMAWKKPKITEVALGAEINMYVCAELKR